MRALIIGDVHLADRPPSLRTATYAQDILDKVQQAVNYAAEYDCDLIIQNGDFFHLKAPSKNSHWLVQQAAKVLTSRDIPVRIVVGNHDVSQDRLESLPHQPLGSLFLTPGIEELRGPDPDFPIFGIPYLKNWERDLPGWMSQFREWSDGKKANDYDFWPLLVTHAPIFPPGETPPYEYIDGTSWAEMMLNGDCTYGHIHDPHGVYSPAAGLPVVLCNNGAISRGSLHEKTVNRKPVVTLWDSLKETGDTFSTLPLDFKPASEVFRMEEHQRRVERLTRASAFIEKVGSTSLTALTLEEVRHEAQTRNFSDETLNVIEQCLEEAHG